MESSLPTFDQFRTVKNKFTYIEEDIEDYDISVDADESDLLKPVIVQDTEENDNSERNEIINNLAGVLNFKIEDDNIGRSPVNIVIGKFSPFNNGHYKLIKKANQHNGYPVSVFVNIGSKGKISRETLEKMMELVKSDLGDVIHSVKFIDNGLLSSAIENLEGDCYPETVTVGKNRLNNYILQSKSLKKRGKIRPEFAVQSAPEWINSQSVIDSIKDKDYLNFKKNTPKAIHGLWEELRSGFNSDI
jgi:hypothetical protein